jgi:multidrug efflux pump subunit AcrA (membrane-fusion protein)
MSKLIYAGASAALLLSLSACGAKPQQGFDPNAPTPVGFVTIRTEPVTLTSELSGRTSAFLVSEVRPQVSGVIKARLFQEGSNVRAGQPLYQIDPATYAASLSSAKAGLAQAQAAYVSAKLKADRYKELVAISAVSKQDNDDAQATAQVTLILEDGSTYPTTGTLAFSDITVDPGTGSVGLRAVFSNPKGALLPGMYVRARISKGVAGAGILAPLPAISRNAKGQPTAFVVGAGDKAEPRVLTVGQTVGDKWLVTSGLKPGDRLIVEGLQKVRPGGALKPAPIAAASR